MKYVIEFDLPDNDTVLHNIKTAWVSWCVWGYSGHAYAKPKQPERKRGKWVKWGSRYKCNQCNLTNEYKKPYCPNCGADMRGENKKRREG